MYMYDCILDCFRMLVLGTVNCKFCMKRYLSLLSNSGSYSWFLGQSTFDSMMGAGLHAVVDTAYQETSKHLLHVLNTQYCFMEHLKVEETASLSATVLRVKFCFLSLCRL